MSGALFKDHFSGHADLYRESRPSYPDALFDQLAALAPARDLALDSGCGNGQASLPLAVRFGHVVATDPSREQIAAAVAHPRIEYRIERAETCSLPDHSLDYAQIAQALHWCDVPAFHREMRRVLKPGGVLAEFGYASASVDPRIDRAYRRLYDTITGPYWPAERVLVERHYSDFEFPFEVIDPGELPLMQQVWNLDQYRGYLASWSAVARYRSVLGHSPLDLIADDLSSAWGDPAEARLVRFDLFLRLGRV